jgi:hypothetical protein
LVKRHINADVRRINIISLFKNHLAQAWYVGSTYRNNSDLRLLPARENSGRVLRKTLLPFRKSTQNYQWSSMKMGWCYFSQIPRNSLFSPRANSYANSITKTWVRL